MHSCISRNKSENLGADVLVWQNLSQPTPQTVQRKRPSPQVRCSIHHTGQGQSPEPSGLKIHQEQEGESSPAWELYGSAVGTLHPWRKPGYSNRNPPKFVSFISRFKKHPHVQTGVSWRHESCEMRHPSQYDEKCFSARVFACMFASRLRWQCYHMWDSQWVILMTPTPPPSRR